MATIHSSLFVFEYGASCYGSNMNLDILGIESKENDATFAVMTRNKHILLGLRHYTKAKWEDRSVWTLAGGATDSGETYEMALRREVQEETGIRDFKIVAYVGPIQGAQPHITCHLFQCTTESDPTLVEPDKFSEWRWVPFQEYYEDSQYRNFNEPGRIFIVKYLQSLS